MLPLCLAIIVYAVLTFHWRNRLIRNRGTTRWDDPFGPVLICSLLLVALVVQFSAKVPPLMQSVLLFRCIIL